MAATMTISLRVPPELRDQLQRAAAEHRTTMSTLAVAAIRAHLDGAVPAKDGPLVTAVSLACTEAGMPEVERQMALNLARTAQAGGTAGVAAVRELRAVMAQLLHDDDDDWMDDLAVPQ
ncbi:hypothetical protein [Kitasatospora sp. NPDC007106]|uniref:hypothetical protein n=1 Tax=Kitasatospora sp. NPDC007106 TaxID=3156914 RepID=UPI00340982AA